MKRKIQHTSSFFIFFISVFFTLSASNLFSQITSDPSLPTDYDETVITFDATGTGLEGYTGDVYAHTGVTIEGVGQWQNVIGGWGDNNVQPQLTRIDTDLYELLLTPSIRDFYNVSLEEVITELCFVFRSDDGSQQTIDLFHDVYEAGLNVSITNPSEDSNIVEYETNIQITASATSAEELFLYIDEDLLISDTYVDELSYNYFADEYGSFWIIAKATSGTDEVYDSAYVFVRPDPIVEELPDGVIPGPNYIDDSTVTLVLHDPPALKEYVFVIGDFNDWMPVEDYYMKVTPDGSHYWLTISGLTPREEYAYQYFIDNEIRLADPYTHKILDPWNDSWISDYNYPDLKPYPEGKTDGYVSIIQPDMQQYDWEVTDFSPPDVEDLVIYELLIRDWINEDGEGAIKDIKDSLDYLQNLGVNAIELMPINHFEGNNSWGYNPALYFATDKAYGTRIDYKKFIDECHKRGIAVILDMVLNHSFNMSPLVQMYFDPDAGNWGQPLPENPWYLEECPTEPWCWGQTFDQDSPYTHELFDRVLEFWLTEFKVDGFRLDFTKGFTNHQSGGDGWDWDQARIDNLKRIYDNVKAVNPDAYVILEHFTENAEEAELANHGMLIWGNLNHAYNEATMGWEPDWDFSWINYQDRGYNNPHLVGYMESHDEERLMYKNQMWGNSSGAPNPYDITELETALERMELAGAFFFTIPGPKMIWQFGELGYDYSIDHCGNDPTVDPIPGNIGDCRVDPKPVRWDYYEDPNRKKLYDVWADLIYLKKNYDVFRTTDFSLDVWGGHKFIYLNHESRNVVVIGNFMVEQQDVTPTFQHTGTWYEFFSDETIEVNDVNYTITLAPGEYRIYSSSPFVEAYSLILEANPPEGGNPIGSGEYEAGTMVTINANPYTGYEFINWTENGSVISTAEEINYEMPAEDVTLVANYDLITYTLEVTTDPVENGGTVDIDDGGAEYPYPHGTEVFLTPVPAEGYLFSHFSGVIDANHTIQASAGDNGAIEPEGTIFLWVGESQTFNFTPDVNYTVSEVYVDDNPVGAQNSYTIDEISANHTIHVTFEEGEEPEDPCIENLPFEEDFTTDVLEEGVPCWETEAIVGETTWVVDGGSALFDEENNNSARMTTPPLNLSGYSEVTLTFDEQRNEETGGAPGGRRPDYLYVEYWDGSAWQVVASYEDPAESFTGRTVNLNSNDHNFNDEYLISFRSESAGRAETFTRIDNVTVEDNSKSSPAKSTKDLTVPVIMDQNRTITAHFIADDILMGDVNNDGVVNVLDVIWIVRHINGDTPDGFNEAAADLTDDGLITVADLTEVVDIILAGAKKEHGDINSEEANMYLEESGLTTFESDGTLIALQFELSGQYVKDAELELLLGTDHTLAFNNESGKGLIFSMTNSIIPAGKVELFNINGVDINNINWEDAIAANLVHELVDVNTHITYDATDIADIVTGISNVSVFPNPNTGDFTVKLTLSEATVIVMELIDERGRLVSQTEKRHLTQGEHFISHTDGRSLNNGMYVVRLRSFDENGRETGIIHEEKIMIIK